MIKNIFTILTVALLLPTVYSATVDCEIINYNENPVYASAVDIEASQVYDALGVAYGSPLAAVSSFDSQPLPIKDRKSVV